MSGMPFLLSDMPFREGNDRRQNPCCILALVIVAVP